jgi:DNA-binding MarR family transcriptional regulator
LLQQILNDVREKSIVTQIRKSPCPKPCPTKTHAPTQGTRILAAIRRIIRAMDMQSRQLAATHQITGPQMACLIAVVQHGPITATEIAHRIHVSASTVVGVLDRLEGKRLVERNRDREDRRLVFIRATARGRSVVAHTPLPLQLILDTALARLSAKEQKVIADSLDQLVDFIHVDDAQTTGGSTGASLR